MKTRQEVPPSDRWNVEALYRDLEDWKNALKNLTYSTQTPFWPELTAYQGTLKNGSKTIQEFLILLFKKERELSKLYTYAHLRHDEDIANEESKEAYGKITTLMHHFAQEVSWFQPELLSLSEKELKTFLESENLKEYRFYLEKIVRMKKHTLSADNEKLIAFAGQALQTSYKAFNALTDADFVFPSILGEHGEEKDLTHGSYAIYLRDQDRTLRKNAFKTYHEKYFSYANTLCELLNGHIQSQWFEARARNYSSCLEAALFSRNIDVPVYRALIEAVHQKLPVLHRYMKFRKKVLQLEEMHLYDVYVPLTSSVDIRLDYNEAEDLVIESVKPLGAEYQEFLSKGLKEQRWVDRYENKNKRSGAYSSGCYDSMPYILMNYKTILRDVFTLAHEAGHSMHSLYSHMHQPYHLSDYPIFLAEVASTFNEDLLTRLLLEKSQNKEEKIFLIHQKIEDIRATLFRQTMFAEFELLIHEQVEKGAPLTPEFLKTEYHQLNQRYFGPDVVIDSEIDIEWARIPHFYYGFYVFQYATGISAATALAEKVVNGSEKDREDYLRFLKSGSSHYPIDTLKMAGVDMTSPHAVASAIATFEQLLNQLEKLMN